MAVKCCLVFQAVFLAALALAHGADVLEIKGQDALEAAIKTHPLLAVAFYSPGSPDWEKLEPELAAVGDELGEAVTLASLNVNEPSSAFVLQIHVVRKFPTILVWKNHYEHRKTTYNGSLDAANITAFLRRRAADPAAFLASKDAVAEFLASIDDEGNEEKAWAIAYVPSDTDPALATFQAAADTMHEAIHKAYVTDRSLIDAPCSATECDSPVLVLHKPGAKKVQRFDGAFEEDTLRIWAESRATRPVCSYASMVGVKNHGFSRASEVRVPHIFGVFEKASDLTDEVMEAFAAAAEDNFDMKFFVTSLEQGFMLCEYLGVDESHKLPMFIASEHWDRRRFGKENMALTDLPQFLEEYRQGKLKKWVRSEDAHGDDDEYDEDDEDGDADEYDDDDDEDDIPRGLIKVTANTWDAKVASAKKPVLLMFIGSFCKRCQDMGEAMGQIFLDNGAGSKFIAATMDGTKNDILDRRFNVKDYPTFYWVPPGADSKVVRFERRYTDEDLREFVEEHLAKSDGKGHDEL